MQIPASKPPLLSLQVISPLGGGALAVATAATESSSRVVVDEYVADGKGGFRLSSMASDLLTYLHKWERGRGRGGGWIEATVI